MPNLENLKKQAKQYLRWHRERYYQSRPISALLLHDFQHLDDNQILESSFKLNDAQELVARQLGFEGGWRSSQELWHDQSKQTDRIPPRVLSSVSAQLFVSTSKRLCEFFTDKLGFALDFATATLHFMDRLFVTMRARSEVSLRAWFVGDIRHANIALRLDHG